MDGEQKSNPNKMFYSVNWFATVTLFSDIKKIKKIKKKGRTSGTVTVSFRQV